MRLCPQHDPALRRILPPVEIADVNRRNTGPHAGFAPRYIVYRRDRSEQCIHVLPPLPHYRDQTGDPGNIQQARLPAGPAIVSVWKPLPAAVDEVSLAVPPYVTSGLPERHAQFQRVRIHLPNGGYFVYPGKVPAGIVHLAGQVRVEYACLHRNRGIR